MVWDQTWPRRRSSIHALLPSACFRVPGCVFRISDFGFRIACFWFRVSCFGCRVSDSGFLASGFVLRFSFFVFRFPCFVFWVSCSVFRFSFFAFRVWISNLVFRVWCFGFWILCFVSPVSVLASRISRFGSRISDSRSRSLSFRFQVSSSVLHFSFFVFRGYKPQLPSPTRRAPRARSHQGAPSRCNWREQSACARWCAGTRRPPRYPCTRICLGENCEPRCLTRGSWY